MMRMKRIMLACLISGLSVFAMNAMDTGSGFEYDGLAGRFAVSTWIRDTFFHELGHVHAWGTEEEKEEVRLRYSNQELTVKLLLQQLRTVLIKAVYTSQDWQDISYDFSNSSEDYKSLGEAAIIRYNAIEKEIKDFGDRFEARRFGKGSGAKSGRKDSSLDLGSKSDDDSDEMLDTSSADGEPVSAYSRIASFITRKNAFLAGIAALAIGGIVWKLYFEDTKKKASAKTK